MNPKTPPYSAGDFRFPVEVQRPVDTPDGSGGATVAWPTHIAVVMCAVEDKAARETYKDSGTGRLEGERSTTFTTWYGQDIVITDRLVFLGRLYNIRRVDNLHNRNKFLRIEADAGVEQ